MTDAPNPITTVLLVASGKLAPAAMHIARDGVRAATSLWSSGRRSQSRRTVLVLCRGAAEAALTSLGAHPPAAGARLEGPLRDVLRDAVSGDDQLDGITARLFVEPLVARNGTPPAEDVDATLAFVGALVDHAEREHDATRARHRSLERAFWILAAGVAVVVSGIALVARLLEKTDLAEGRPFRASSAAYTCHPERETCAGLDIKIAFHTNQEASPWYEVDLGAPRRVRSALVRNRSDCCMDRAVPLILEVSTDGASFNPVAERTTPFLVWAPSFPEIEARFVRVRVPRETTLHLERLSVYP
jgi:hypothetical protein